LALLYKCEDIYYAIRAYNDRRAARRSSSFYSQVASAPEDEELGSFDPDLSSHYQYFKFLDGREERHGSSSGQRQDNDVNEEDTEYEEHEMNHIPLRRVINPNFGRYTALSSSSSEDEVPIEKNVVLESKLTTVLEEEDGKFMPESAHNLNIVDSPALPHNFFHAKQGYQSTPLGISPIHKPDIIQCHHVTETIYDMDENVRDPDSTPTMHFEVL